MPSDNKISAGSYDLNKWLFGGYERDIITTIYGDAGTGKTNFCLLVAVSQALKDKKVLFIDTEGGFSAERVKQIVASDKEKCEKALGNMILLKPVNFEEQKRAFIRLLKEIKEDSSIGAIIVDGMTMLYRLELGETGEGGAENVNRIREINHELAKQLRVLAEIARNRNISVIVTNQVYSTYVSHDDKLRGVISEVRMVGGDLLKYWSKCLIKLENSNGKRKAVLVKHRSLKEKEFNFYITDTGIKKRGFM